MPANYIQLSKIIPEAVTHIPPYREEISRKVEQARQAFYAAEAHQDELACITRHLTEKVDRLLRCASPTEEPLTAQYPPGRIACPIHLAAADGSQVLPDETEAEDGFPWGMVNTAGLVMKKTPDGWGMPEIRTETELFLENIRYTPNGILSSNESVDLYRDVRERELLTECALTSNHMNSGANTEPDQGNPVDGGQTETVLALLDQSMELWGAHDKKLSGNYKTSLKQAVSAFLTLKQHRCYYAGVVQTKRSELLVRFLEIAMTPEKDLHQLRAQNPLMGVTDAMVLDGILKPGFRSAIFELRTRGGSLGGIAPELAVYFFYLNLGDDQGSSDPLVSNIFRIEVPAWYRRESVIALLHTVILDQSTIIPGHHYPFILARCHEEAVLSFTERQNIKNMLALEYARQKIPMLKNTSKMLVKRVTR